MWRNPPPSAGRLRAGSHVVRGHCLGYLCKVSSSLGKASAQHLTPLIQSLLSSPTSKIVLPVARHHFHAGGFPQIPLPSLPEPEGEGGHLWGGDRAQLRAAAQLSLLKVRLRGAIWGCCWSGGWLSCPKTGAESCEQGSGCRREVHQSGWPWEVGNGGKLSSQNLGKAPSTWFCSYSFSTDPGLVGSCPLPLLCIALFHICCAEIMMWVGSSLITNTMSLVLL